MSGDIADALAALISFGIGDFVYKRAAAAGLPAQHFLMGQAWFFGPAILLYAFLTGRLHPVPAALWGGGAGLLIAIGFYNYVHSLRTGAVGLVAPVFRLNFLVTAALAIFWLGEPLTAPKLGGFLLALVAGWLLLGAPRRGAGLAAAAARGPLLRVLIATAATGMANFCYKLGLLGGATPETMLVAQAVVFGGLLTAMTGLTSGSIRPPRGFVLHSAPAALVQLAAFLFLLHALQHGAASVVVPIAQMGFVVAALLGALVFGEAWTARKLAGLSAAIAALLLLALG